MLFKRSKKNSSLFCLFKRAIWSERTYVGVPIVLGANGVEKIVEINLKKEEKKEFIQSVNSVKEVLNVAKKII